MATQQVQPSPFQYIAPTEENIFDFDDTCSQGQQQGGNQGNQQGFKGFSSEVSNRQRQQRRQRGGNQGVQGGNQRGNQGGQGGNQQQAQQQGGQGGQGQQQGGNQQGGQGGQGGPQSDMPAYSTASDHFNKAVADNHSNQLNPNNPAFYASRGIDINQQGSQGGNQQRGGNQGGQGGNQSGNQGGQGGNQQQAQQQGGQGGQGGNQQQAQRQNQGQGQQQGGNQQKGNQGGQQSGQGSFQQGQGGGFNQPQGVQGPFGRFVGEALNYSCNPSAAQQPPQSLKELFTNIPLESMMIENWIRKRLVLVGDNQPLDKALQHLNRHKITALPIINEQNGNIMGILNVLDIVNYLCSVLDSEGFGSARWDFVLKNTGQLLQECNSRPMVISNQANMFDAIQILSQGCHRLMVVDNNCQPHQQQGEEKDILGLLTQSDIIRFLSENPYWLKMCENSKKSLGQLNIFGNNSNQVLTIEQNQLTRDAFKKMAENNSGGIAVVDDQGRLVAHMSGSNVRGISRANFQLLNRPVFEFLQRDRRRGWWSMPVCLNENDSLEKAILQFAATRVHQMYVCDEQGKPQHVVDLTDMIKMICSDSPMSA